MEAMNFRDLSIEYLHIDQLKRKHKPLYVLESFFYVRDWQKDLPSICEEFMLDSGAFTFMNSKKATISVQTVLKTLYEIVVYPLTKRIIEMIKRYERFQVM